MVVGDGGETYRDTYYDDAWTEAKEWQLHGPLSGLERFTATGTWGVAPAG